MNKNPDFGKKFKRGKEKRVKITWTKVKKRPYKCIFLGFELLKMFAPPDATLFAGEKNEGGGWGKIYTFVRGGKLSNV